MLRLPLPLRLLLRLVLLVRLLLPLLACLLLGLPLLIRLRLSLLVCLLLCLPLLIRLLLPLLARLRLPLLACLLLRLPLLILGRRRSFLFLSLVFLRLLCPCRSRGPKKQEQSSRSDDSSWPHLVFAPLSVRHPGVLPSMLCNRRAARWT
jgi:hypothetical protein